MPVLYLTTPQSTLRRQAGRLLVEADGLLRPIGPIAHVERVCVMGAVSITPPALNLLLGAGCTVVFLTRQGRLKGLLARPATGEARGRLAQAHAVTQPAQRLALAGATVSRKVRAMRALLAERHRRDPSEALRSARLRLDRAAHRLPRATSTAALRGLEGAATAAYYRALATCFTGPLAFSGRRSRRPPRDEANALLSFLYVLLVQEASDALAVHGLDPSLGFLHDYRAGRPSLACDLAEPFRPLGVDRLALHLLNRAELRPEHFGEARGGGVHLHPDALPTVITAWETWLQAPVPAYAAAALTPSGPDAAVPAGLRGLLHRHARAVRARLLASTDVDALLA